MRRLLNFLLLMCIVLPLCAQQQRDRDDLAKLNLSGSFPTFTLAPDGNC